MTQLPASIEQYLEEAGFTVTEIFVLKRLIEGSSLTLRELAAKTGKSTGVLSQAMKKLMDKGIVGKKSINNTEKYSLTSLDAVQCWMEDDMLHRHAALKRKKESFDAFISTLEQRKDMPDIEYYEGRDGIAQAFDKLLRFSEKEWLQFQPACRKEEEDPLASERAALFRMRQKKSIFLRAIAPDTPQGRRCQTRDNFEHKETHLMTPENFPVQFEQYIVGDTVACFDAKNLKASFINYPELADGLRKVFEILWSTQAEGKKIEKKDDERVKLLTELKEFFCSKKSLHIFATFAVVAGVVTWGMHHYVQQLNLERVRERVRAIAATAAPQLSYEELSAINDYNDIYSHEYTSIVTKLNEIRNGNAGVEYAYVMRKTDNPYFFEFIADADSFDFQNRIDLNEDGLINDQIPPGQYWFDSDPSTSAIHRAFNKKEATSDQSPIEDDWGVWISGHAPIFNSNSEVIAVLGVDVFASSVDDLTKEDFNSFAIFIALFGTFYLISVLIYINPLKLLRIVE